MKIPQITIHQTFGKIGLQITPADLQIQKENSHVNVEYAPSETQVKYQDPDIQVDWQPVWDDIGLKGAGSVGKDIRDKGNRATLEAIGQISKNGDRLGNIASGEKKAIANIAREAYHRKNRVETTIVSIPSKGPTYKAKTYAPEINVELGSVKVSPNNIEPKIDYRIGDISVYWLQRPNVDISV